MPSLSFSSSIFNIRQRYRIHKSKNGSLGYKFRSKLAAIEDRAGPHLAKLFPSFIHAHYAYITCCALLGSILIYPKKNIAFIDALFLASGGSTQAGLNTVDINKLALYQQIVIHCICFLTTPIFIHGFILLLRLYWFERTFDDIKATSKLNHKMRRTATLAAINSKATSEKIPIGVTSDTNIPTPAQQSGFTSSTDFYNYPTQKEAVLQGSPSSPDTSKEASSSGSSQQNNNQTVANTETLTEGFQKTSAVDNEDLHSRDSYNNVPHLSEPSDSDHEEPKFVSPDETQANASKDIKFAEELPHPSKRAKEMEPQDMYMSIAMMQNNHKLQHPDDDNDEMGPALVISGPAERERIRKKKSGHHRKRPRIRKFMYDKNLDENIDDVEMNTSVRRKSAIQFKVPIPGSKSRTKSGTFNSPWSRRKGTAEGNMDGELNSENSENPSDASENDEDYALSKAQTNLALPSADQTEGIKYSKRANTLDVNPLRRPSMLLKATTLDNVFRHRKMKRKRNMRRYSSSVFNDDDDDDDEEDNKMMRTASRNAVSGNYLSWNPTIARNSTFVALTDEQKEELGGVEYRAVKLLSKIVVAYYLGFHTIAVLCYLPFIVEMKHYSNVMREDGIAPAWWGFFTPGSVFNDLGYTLNPDSMIPFYKNAYILLISGFFIIIGNTGFPIFLRFIIWVLFKLSKRLSLLKESLGFLLDHPRRCFTLLFPSIPTWWLFFILVALNAIDLVLFIILDLHNPVLTAIPVGYRVLDGLFQAFSTRTAGFAVVDLSKLHPSVQVSYMLMMYISVLPLAISIRRTNVYEEQSLGIYGGPAPEASDATPKSFVATHLRNQLSFDLWFIFLGLFIICIADGSKLQKNESSFTIFAVLFEIVSAYGTVGLSLGYPNTTTSLSAQFTVVSKLVIIAMMIRGRHRGLPYSLDRAIILPSDKMKRIDKLQEKYGHSSLTRVNTMNTTESRTRTNLFNRVKTLGDGIFNIGGPIDHSSWIDSRLPQNERERSRSTHQPENITFTLGRNGNTNDALSPSNTNEIENDIQSLDSEYDSEAANSASPRGLRHTPSAADNFDNHPIGKRTTVTRAESF